MSIYSDKLAHVQIVINSWFFAAQMCTCEDMLAHILGALYIDDVMSYNSLTILLYVKLLQKCYLISCLSDQTNSQFQTGHFVGKK